MKIVSVSTQSRRYLIPITGWDNVEKAITFYASGAEVPSSNATQKELVTAVGKSDSGGMGVGLLLLAGANVRPDDFTKRLLASAKKGLAERDRWKGDYDYDGMGTRFFKTCVDIVRLDRNSDVYGIGISAAYVGNEPEIELAKALGIERALSSCSVVVTTERLDRTRFEFDFEPVLRKLDSIRGLKNRKGTEAVKAMMTTDQWGSSRPAFTIATFLNGIVVSLVPGKVDPRMDYMSGKAADTWQAEGSILRGNLARDYESDDETAKADPSFSILVAPVGTYPEPLWNPDDQKRMLTLADSIQAALAK